MFQGSFCPNCGHKRLGNFRFCTGCKFDFDMGTMAPTPAAYVAPSPAVTPAPPAPTVVPSNTLALLAGLAWLGTAAVTAYLAFLQLDYGNTLRAAGLDDQGLSGLALWNGMSAILTAVFGAKCLRNPTRGFLGFSIFWGVVSVGWGTYQVINGATHWAFIAGLIGAGLAGILSFVARENR